MILAPVIRGTAVAFSIVMIVAFVRFTVHAASMNFVSDLISTSAPNAASTHIIQFTVDTAVPPTGKIVISGTDAAFTVQSGFDYSDVDLEIASGGPYAQRQLSNLSSATHDGISVGPNVIAIDLNSTSGISAGDTVRITLGDASYEAVGNRWLVNPGVSGSYRISIQTRLTNDDPIDTATAMIAIVAQVTAGTQAQEQPPVRVNGLPSGVVAANNPAIEISFETNENATCRYSTTPGLLYSTMTNTFDSSGQRFFFTEISGHQNSTSYTYYVRCIDTDGNFNDDDYEITFSLAATPISDTSVASGSGSSGRGGVGPFPDGSDVLYLADATLMGWGPPQSTVSILVDGVPTASTQTSSDGTFSTVVRGLERGTYTFLTYATDPEGRRTGSFSATLSLQSGTRNSITDIVIPPTISLSKQSTAVGEDVTLSGLAVPNSFVEAYVTRQTTVIGFSDVHRYSATSSPAGRWEILVDGGDLEKGTYSVQARSRVGTQGQSGMSRILLLGVGEIVSTSGIPGDLNHDGKVNLVDFSILLSFWNTDDENADINGDTTVNLADFSIQLFNWTG